MLIESGQKKVFPTSSDQFDVYVPDPDGALMLTLRVSEPPTETSANVSKNELEARLVPPTLTMSIEV